ncbi:hydrogenase maturation peptidase HycI [Methanobrevibacter curvatus]|uniref:Hydrogenase 3 maturation protease n=1 Tax=Methanobrevibacter curvatus TaxID=49547 RepID=A0A166B0C1_9EURY|nr:hydrogenase maturation peptidase HycI [Methanobrevibacter curvatus]KZX12702.1 hydrogenase 3 maturation protease [Methanobrevibacter curvatus]
MSKLLSSFKEFLKYYDYENNLNKLIIMGIGNTLRGDDGIGVIIIEELQKYFNHNFHKNIFEEKNILLLNCQSVPENFTGLIKMEKPSHLIILDAVLLDDDPGTIRLIEKEEISNFSSSSHSMSISFFIKFLEEKIKFKSIICGINPKSMEISTNLSQEINLSKNIIVNTLINLIESL